MNLLLVILVLIFMKTAFYYREKSNKDLFTGCYNKDWAIGRHNSLLVQLMIKANKKKGESFGVLIIDIDDFKSVNDNLGHWFGDELLLKVVKYIKKYVGKNDAVVRYGGDEFLIFLKDAHKLSHVAEIIRDAVFHYTLRTVSIGGIVYEKGPIKVEDVINRVDKNVYTAKKLGKDQVFIS